MMQHPKCKTCRHPKGDHCPYKRCWKMRRDGSYCPCDKYEPGKVKASSMRKIRDELRCVICDKPYVKCGLCGEKVCRNDLQLHRKYEHKKKRASS